MFKKLTAIAILVISIPVAAYAGAWTLNTWARSAGGTISVDNGTAYRVTDGSQFANYTAGGSNQAGLTHTITITPDPGYTATTNKNQTGLPADLLTFTSADAVVQPYGSGSIASLWVVFHATTIPVTATTVGNCTVNLASLPNVYPDTVAPRDIVFTFTAAPGYQISGVTGALSFSVTGTNTSVAKVTIPKLYAFDSTLTYHFIATAIPSTTVATANAVVKKSPIANNTFANFSGSSIGAAATSRTWSCIAAPNGVTMSTIIASNTGNKVQTINLTTNGTYVFQYTVNGTAKALTSVQVVTTLPAAATALSVGNTCQKCHTANGIAASNIYSNYSSSIHKKGGTESGCSQCHYGTGNGGHPGTVNASTVDPTTFLTKFYNINADGSSAAALIATPGAGVVMCEYCHNDLPGAYAHPPTHVSLPLNPGITCTGCHTDPLGQGNGTGDAHSILPYPTCVQCHAVGQKQVNSTLVNDNNGVRQITGAGGEFKQWSHHIINDTNTNSNTADPLDAQCVVCHMEGKISATTGAVSVNTPKHMNDGNIYLRDCNTGLSQNKSDGTEFVWNPANPDHTAMDQFCMSCHNAAGAVTAPRPTGTPKTATALNPFGDLIQNNYDGLSRNAVVAVYDQFDPSNTSHHAVRAARYTANTADTTAAQGFNMFPAGVTKVTAATGTFANISANNAEADFTNLRYANGTSYVGTMADTGKFITTYKPLVDNNVAASFKPLADNSQIHCGDCHTVGQWAARGSTAFQAYSTAYGPGVTKFYKKAIGAHGSGNEYMLRNNNGDNSLNPNALVCYNCHASTLYGSGGASTATRVKLLISGVLPTGPQNGGGIDSNVSWTLYNYTSAARSQNVGINFGGNMYGATLYNDPQVNQMGAVATSGVAHDGIAGSINAGHCNDEQNNTAGLTGLARLNSMNKTAIAFGLYSTGHYANAGGANAFGIKCANCHNSSDNTYPSYGGIHGNAFRPATPAADGSDVVRNQSYTTYSTSTGAKVTGGGGHVDQVSHKPYRFLPGLGNFRYNGGGDWSLYINRDESGTFNSVGCYTLQGSSSAEAIVTYPKNGHHQSAFTGSSKIVSGAADDNGLMGTWGACTEHTAGPSGASGASSEGTPTRNVLRPTSY